MNQALYGIANTMSDIGVAMLKKTSGSNDDEPDVYKNDSRVPLFASATDIGKNLYNLWDFGYSGNISKPAGLDFAHKKWSVGGMIGLPLMVGAGAGIGAVAGSFVDNPYGTAVGAGVGGLAVLGAPVMLGLAARGVIGGSGKIGQGMFNIGKNLLFSTGGAEEGIGAGSILGKIGVGAAKVAIHAPGFSTILNPNKFVKQEADRSKGFAGVKFNALGKTVIGLGIAGSAIGSAWNTEAKIREGQIDPNIRRSTPQIPSYADNAGATGDLVFAMNRNRRG